MNILKSILTLMLLLICFCFISGSFFGIGSHFSNSVKTMAIQRKWISETCIYLDTDHLIPFSSWNRLTRDLSLNTGISRTSISFANSVIISDLTDRWVFRLCDGLWLGLDGGKYSVHPFRKIGVNNFADKALGCLASEIIHTYLSEWLNWTLNLRIIPFWGR